MADMEVDDRSGSSTESRRTRAQRVRGETSPTPLPADVESAGEDEDDQPPSSVKRRRLNAPAATQDDDDEPEEEEDRKPNIEVRRQVERDEHGFATGYILRIQAFQFLTYDSVSFTLGPKLNMIIGPNGTGKSSIVCAIAIGLAFSPKVLGRSDNVADFVKKGHTHGWVEIELKGKPGQRNVVVKRTIDFTEEGVGKKAKAGVQSKFFLNGAASTEKAVKAKVKGLGIDVNNLCTFLPQDRVSKFSEMNAMALLKATQQCAGAPALDEWHTSLIHTKKDLDKASKDLHDTEASLKKQEDSLGPLQREVEKYENRRRVQEELAVLEVHIPFARYQAAKAEYDALRVEKATVERALVEAEREHEPFVRTRDMLARRIARLNPAKQAITSRQTKLDTDFRNRSKAIERIEEGNQEIREKMEGLRAAEDRRQREIARYRRNIKEGEDKLAKMTEPQAADTRTFDTQMAACNAQIRQVKREIGEVQQQIDGLRHEMGSLDRDAAGAKRRLDQINNLTHIREQNYARQEPKTWQVVEWVRQQAQHLPSGCNDPLPLSVEVPNFARFGKIIETLIPGHNLRMPIAKSQRDYEILLQRSHDAKMKFSMAYVNPDLTMADFPAPFGRDRLNDLGFECWAIDCVTAPPSVMIFLCQSCNFHRIPIGFNNDRINHKEVEHVNSGVRRYIAGDQQITIGFSAYGSREAHSTSKFIANTRLFKSGADPEVRVSAERAIAEVEDKKRELAGRGKELDGNKDALARTLSGIEDNLADWKRQKDEASAELTKWTRLNVALESDRSNLERALARATSEAERQRLTDQLRTAAISRMAESVALKAIMLKRIENQDEQIKWSFEHMQANSDLEGLQQSSGQRESALREKREAVQAVDANVKRSKASALVLFNAARSLLDSQPDTVREKYQASVAEGGIGEPEELEGRAEELRNTLDMTADVAGEVTKQYEDRKALVKKLTGQRDQSVVDMKKRTERVNKLKNSWVPAIKALVERISEKFSQSFSEMGNQGEVRVVEDEQDYDKWGIDIKVAFRDTDQLMSLDGHRQSGGERSLSTITYLMALTSLANSPISVVDEINQGMDQRAERGMHDQLVRETCGPNANQYFLITPKLLTNLRYDKDMRILCVCNGEWCPDELSLSSLLQGKRNQKAAR